METFRQFRWICSPKNTLWACAYVLLVGLKPYVQEKIEHLLELAPTDLILIAFGLVVLYFILLPKQVREQFKDMWQGGEARVRARLALDDLKAKIDKCSPTEQSQGLFLSMSMMFCMALTLFQAENYEGAIQTVSAAKHALESRAKDSDTSL